MTEATAHFDTALTPAKPVDVGPHPVARAARQQPLGVAAVAYLIVLVLAGLFAPLVAPYPPDKQNLLDVLSGPSASHWLGTDSLGRDVLSRLLYGINPTLSNTLVALVVFLLIGIPVGIIAGYRGGWLDNVIGRVVELTLSIPAIIIVLVVIAVFSANPTAAMITLGVLAAPGLSRVVRGATLVVREELFVTAAVVSGVRPLRIMTSHVIRRVAGPILVQASVFAGIALAFQAALAFLGLLSAGERPTWGGMIADGSQVITTTTWLIIPPGLAVVITVLAFGLLGDAVRDLASADETTTAPAKRRQPAPARPAKQLDAPTSTAPGAGDLLDVHGLTVTAGSITLVSDATFTVRPGETVALVGESGCGKSMTALAVLGLLPGGVHTSGGAVTFHGTDLTGGGSKAYRAVRGSGIAYIAQDALGSLDPTHTVGRHLTEIIGRHEKLSSGQRKARAVELLHEVKLSDTTRVLASYPHEISGGMAQRINIAIALAGRPELIIADEPTTALDVTVQADILQLLRELQQQTGMAILLITHDWGVVADIADRVVVMYAGEVVEQAGIDTLFGTPRFPYTAALLGADPSTAVAGARLPILPGRVPPPGQWPTGCRFAGRCAYATDDCTAEPIPLMTIPPGSVTRCIRVDDLVAEGALPR